ncbi:MAG: carboxypeptidase regulatory-like domain-containing protein [Nitrospirota bacterium]|nr:carboxypeptidase regulatory-like domain-containing protein [Nitrospirota bacterium]
MRRALIPMLALWSSLCAGMGLADGGSGSRFGESGEFLEVEYQANGQRVKGSFPLYRAEGVRYFSAGVGIEERSAEYPPFSLKLVFTAGGKPFLAGVSVIIQSAKGGPPINIPRDHVNGPWLFVDLPSGTYHLTAVHADRTESLKGVRVEAGKMKTVHLRWQEERRIAASSGEAVSQ